MCRTTPSNVATIRPSWQCRRGWYPASGKKGNDDKKPFFIDCEKNPFFVDRNGLLFQYVLDYLRTSKLCFPSSVSPAAMKEEFEYYGIDVDMNQVNQVKEKKDDCQEKPIIDDLSVILAEKLAIQVSAFVEYNFIRRNLPNVDVKTVLPTFDYSHLKGHEDLLRERLLARGLEYISSDVSSTRAWVTAKKAEGK